MFLERVESDVIVMLFGRGFAVFFFFFVVFVLRVLDCAFGGGVYCFLGLAKGVSLFLWRNWLLNL